jgi:hypothetical protein
VTRPLLALVLLAVGAAGARAVDVHRRRPGAVGPVRAAGPHSYFGLDAKVVDAIADWIVAASPVAKP